MEINKNKTKKRFKVSIHPLFLVLAIFMACTGQLLLFLVYTIVAIVHEFGHAIYASRLGYKLNRIQLMPFGAVIEGDIEGISMRDEIFLALAGPFTNLACAVAFAGMWWFFPVTYPYTELAFTASLTICLMNVLPAHSLDGGRILFCIFAKWKNRKVAEILLLCTTIAIILVFIILGAIDIVLAKKINSIAISLFLFALFILLGMFSRKNYRYERLKFNKSKAMQRGIEVKKIAVDSQATIKQILQFLEQNRLIEIEVFANNDLIAMLSEQEFYQILQRADIYQPIAQYL